MTAIENEALRLVGSIVIMVLAWVFGNRLNLHWSLRQKRRELDLAIEREFHLLYGEFFSTWKLWNYYLADGEGSHLERGSRWELLKRASDSEGRLEATLVRLACDYELKQEDIAAIGAFRQIYQLLRGSIRDGKPLEWRPADHPQYAAFKSLATEIARLILDGRPNSRKGDAAAVLLEITSNRWVVPDLEKAAPAPLAR